MIGLSSSKWYNHDIRRFPARMIGAGHRPYGLAVYQFRSMLHMLIIFGFYRRDAGGYRQRRVRRRQVFVAAAPRPRRALYLVQDLVRSRSRCDCCWGKGDGERGPVADRPSCLALRLRTPRRPRRPRRAAAACRAAAPFCRRSSAASGRHRTCSSSHRSFCRGGLLLVQTLVQTGSDVSASKSAHIVPTYLS